MNVFEVAMKMEDDGKAYYQKLAAQTAHEGLHKIFLQLAEDEQKHHDIFKRLKEKTPTSMQKSTALEQAKNVFETLIASRTNLTIAGDLDGYRHAMKLEANSFRFYEEAAAKEQDAKVKELLLQIAGEEQKHFNILQNVYDFVNAPNQFLAWAEFSNLGEFRNFGRDSTI
ncbi:MAG: ferritin family protein [Desulfuromonadales bacterium]|uniref:ferritin-like domain-containing protein n=1 Tax=Desulfuromonas sp. KJ2020 TaxID=2919173 RepID=UPI0020A790EF|nr:ferritin family protein [Desulfuromonas sp. KJ2020]MCP3175475.1 ferritin family protein [Desulfuromonas sp. KJ2020]